MQTVTLISTVHIERGKCNSDELYRIIESIRPEVIFEELSKTFFDMYYQVNQFADEPLEVTCIKKYVRYHPIRHIPVDIELSPNLPKGDIYHMFTTFEESDVYNRLKHEQSMLTAQEGFAYLNSEECLELFDKIKDEEINRIALETSENILSKTHKLLHDLIEIRECGMLQNIYDYSLENQYNQSIFLIGAAHRKSIIEKIPECEAKNNIKLNWKFYGA